MIETEKQILSAYIDGTLPASKKAEFENLLRTRVDLQEEILMRRAQISRITTLIPRVNLNQEGRANIESEVKATLAQVIDSRNESLWERIKEKLSR